MMYGSLCFSTAAEQVFMRLIFVSQFQSSVNETGSHQAKHMHKATESRENSHVGPHITHQVTQLQPPRNNTFVLKHNNNILHGKYSRALFAYKVVPYNQVLLKYFGRKCQIFWHLQVLRGVGCDASLNKSYQQCSIKRHRNFTILSGFSTACF